MESKNNKISELTYQQQNSIQNLSKLKISLSEEKERLSKRLLETEKFNDSLLEEIFKLENQIKNLKKNG